MHYLISGCDEKGIEKIKKLEQENGLLLLAYKESQYDYDNLSEDDLSKVNQLEKELGIKIIALKKK
ncbi:hypothetical protein [uncultured Ilyobacter sp.]|uniref:hypothetical protein n=1 Tax=uncultured Ilyobacter sp. TaxID=544433 RepID=UPI0029C0B33C|nr:hypothetical protein [uncultured Ilyobacter sp.]